MISRIDHVSIAVKDYDKAMKFFQKIFNLVPGASASDPEMKYSWEIFSAGDLSRIEIINPTGQGSFLDNFLSDKKDGGVHHITFETPDIYQAKQRLEDNNIPYFGFNDHGDIWKELFIHPKHAFGVLIQIAEFRPDEWINPSLVFQGSKKWSVEKGENKTELSFAHPGGGKVKIELTKEEVKKLIDDLAS